MGFKWEHFIKSLIDFISQDTGETWMWLCFCLTCVFVSQAPAPPSEQQTKVHTETWRLLQQNCGFWWHLLTEHFMSTFLTSTLRCESCLLKTVKLNAPKCDCVVLMNALHCPLMNFLTVGLRCMNLVFSKVHNCPWVWICTLLFKKYF